MKAPLNCFFPILIAGMLVTASFAERAELLPPEPLTFDPREHMKPAYRGAVDALCDGEGVLPTAVASLCETLNRTLNQEELLQALKEALGKLPAETRWIQQAQALNEMVGSGRYVLTVPVEFQELETGGWEVRWRGWNDETRSWSGPVEVRRLTSIPYMGIRIVATVAEGGGRMRFGYGIRNSAESAQKISSMEVECVGLTRERSSELEKLRQMPTYTRDHLVSGRLLAVSLPSFLSERPVFSLWSYDPTTQRLFAAKPGETLELAPVLEVPWSNLPGVVRCWVEMPEYPYPLGLDAERDSEEVQEIVMTPRWEDVGVGRPVRFPRWSYHGKTIGPVPAPDEGTPREKWVDQLVAWHAEARKWGWYDKDGAELWETRAAKLKADASDDRIRDLLPKVEEDHQAGRLLAETYALWRYNLEYLLKMPQPGK